MQFLFYYVMETDYKQCFQWHCHLENKFEPDNCLKNLQGLLNFVGLKTQCPQTFEDNGGRKLP